MGRPPSLIYRLAKPLLDRAGMEVVPAVRHEKKGFTPMALRREKDRGFQPGTVIDVGASDGRWSCATAQIFPAARYHLLEPLAERESALQKLCAERKNFSYSLAAASDHVGTAALAVSEDLDGSALSSDTSTQTSRTVALTTIDAEITKLALPAPYLIKLDTHGFEPQILRGSAQSLAQTQLFIIEAYNYPLFPGCWQFPQLCQYMESIGFRCSDIVDLVWRPDDQALWQMDIFFRPAISPLFQSNSYQ
jgi:FkbM family methyltransferase